MLPCWELCKMPGEEMGQGGGGWWKDVGPWAGGHPGESLRANGDWDSQRDVGEELEERKGPRAAQALHSASSVLTFLGPTNPSGRQWLHWVLPRAPHSWGNWSSASGFQTWDEQEVLYCLCQGHQFHYKVKLRTAISPNWGWQRLGGSLASWSCCEWTEMLFRPCNSRIHRQERDCAIRNKIIS